MSVPLQFKGQRYSYRAGYRAGYAGLDPQPELRGKDKKPACEAGFAKGRTDRAKRELRKQGVAA